MQKSSSHTIARLTLISALSLGTALFAPLSASYAGDAKNAAAEYEASTRAELELKNKEAQIKQLKTVLNEKSDKLEELESQISAQELLLREKDILEAEISTMEKKMGATQEALTNAKDNIVFKERREEELNALISQMEQMIKDHESLLRQNEKYEQILKDKGEVESQMKGLAEDKRRMAENMQILQDEYDSATQQLDVMKGEKLGAYEEQIAQRDLEIAELRNQVQALAGQIQQAQTAPAPIAPPDDSRLVSAKTAAEPPPIPAAADWGMNEAARLEQAMKEEGRSAASTSASVKASAAKAAQETSALLPLPESKPQSAAVQEETVGMSGSILSAPPPAATLQQLDDLSFENQELHRQNEALKTFLNEMSETIRSVSAAQIGQGGQGEAVSGTGGVDMIPIANDTPSAVGAYSSASALSEAERMELEMMGGVAPASSPAAATPAIIAGQPIPPKVYYKPSIPVPGLLQASAGYVPATLGVLATASGPDKIVYQWHEGDLYSSAEQSPMGDREFDEFVRDYLLQTEERCQGDFAAVPVDTRDVGDVRIDSYDIACIIDENGMNAAASLLFFNKDGTFTVISNETATSYVDQAMDKRDQVIHAIEGGSFL